MSSAIPRWGGWWGWYLTRSPLEVVLQVVQNSPQLMVKGDP